MASDTLAYNVRGRHVEPRSSVLDMQTLDVDVSGFTVPPLDGEFVFFNGALQAADNTIAELTVSDTDLGKGASLCMVWSEHGRSDIQAYGRKRVPVIFRHSFHMELGLYNYDSTALPTAGDPVIVAECQSDIFGDSGTTRMVADIGNGKDLAAGRHWVVGYVAKGPDAAGEPVEIVLYDQPRLVNGAA